MQKNGPCEWVSAMVISILLLDGLILTNLCTYVEYFNL